MSEPLFPLWQIDDEEYRAVCAHLGLTPDSALHARLSRYLGEAPFRFPAPRGFARYLAERKLTRFRIRRMDALTKLLLPGHPLRHRLNGVVALHECNGRGYRELSATARGWAAWGRLFAFGVRFALDLAISLPWLAWQWAGYAIGGTRGGLDELSGIRVLITGVHRGLGRDLALQCLERGAEVIGVVRDEASGDGLRAELPGRARLRLVASDLSKPGMLPGALRDSGITPESVAMAIVSAGTKQDGSSVLTLGALRETFEVNFFAAAELTAWLCGHDAGARSASDQANEAAAQPGVRANTMARSTESASDTLATTGHMSATTRVVLVSSMGRWHGMPFSAGYNASKAALSIWGESLDMELRTRGKGRYTVTIVEPGMFASGMMRQSGLMRALLVSRTKVAERILRGALAGRMVIRPPRWFALLTWMVCALGREHRARLFAKARPRSEDR